MANKYINTGDDKADKLLTFAAVGTVLFFGAKIVGGINDIFNPNKQREREKDKSIENIPVNNNKLQFLPAVYKRIAQQQFDAMNLFGTDEKLLFDSLRGLNNDDLKQVYKEFGTRKPDLKLNVPFGTEFGDASDLFVWYRAELDNADLNKMRNIWLPTGLWN